MTKREAAIIMAYTGFVTLKGKDLKYFAEYASKLLGYPVYTHDFGVPSVTDELHEKSKNDFIQICKEVSDDS